MMASLAGKLQVISLLSGALHLDPGSWLNDDGPAAAEIGSLNCFTRAGVNPDQVKAPHRVIVRTAELALRGFNRSYVDPEESPLELRSTLLRGTRAENRNYIALSDLINYAWACGIPVIHVKDFGKGVAKMDAAVVNVQDRPVIAICRDDNAFAKVAYKLAHELGHVAKGHWRDYGFIADVEFKVDDHDDIEREADEFACTLIYGDAHFRFSPLAIDPSEVVATGHAREIDPHALLLAFLREAGKKNPAIYRQYDKVQRGLSAGQKARTVILKRLFSEIEADLLTASELNQLQLLTEATQIVGSPC